MSLFVEGNERREHVMLTKHHSVEKKDFLYFFAQMWNWNPPPVMVCSGVEQATEIYSQIKEQTQRHLDSYARDGLRTLCIAKKVVLETAWLYLFTPKKSQTL